MDRFSNEPTPVGYGVIDTGFDPPRYLAMVQTQEQADYATMVLNAGGIDVSDSVVARDDVELLVLYTNCVSCERTFMQGTLDASKRCVECQP